MDLRNRHRLVAVLIAAIFAAPVLIALVLAMTGWVPHGRSYGQPIRPVLDLADIPVRLAGGQPFTWTNHDAVWTLVALPGPGCARHCLRQLDLAHRAQITLAKSSDKLRLLYLGDPPRDVSTRGFARVWKPATTPSHALDGLRSAVPDSVSLVLVSPDGTALTRYADNFDAEGLRKDLKKAVH